MKNPCVIGSNFLEKCFDFAWIPEEWVFFIIVLFSGSNDTAPSYIEKDIIFSNCYHSIFESSKSISCRFFSEFFSKLKAYFWETFSTGR